MERETERRESEAGAENILDDVGRVSADCDHLAVRHVDDAHKAEGDGETEGDDEENTAEAESAEEGAEKIDGGEMAIDGVEGEAGGGGERGMVGGFSVGERSLEGIGAADGVQGGEFIQ